MTDIGLTWIEICVTGVAGFSMGWVLNCFKELSKLNEHNAQIEYNLKQIYRVLRECQLENKENTK